MLVAKDRQGNRCIAFETQKSEAPFFCPECKGELVLKKGIKRDDHFAHKPPYDCSAGEGEGELHNRVKREIYTALLSHKNCSDCQLERQLDGVRPDVSALINNTPVAIEVQKSTIDIDEITERTVRYTALGYFVLWLVPSEEGETTHEIRWIDPDKDPDKYYYEVRDVYRPKQWEVFLHAMYFGRAYYWYEGAEVGPIHFDKIEQYQVGKGYHKTLKSIKNPNYGPVVHIAEDFQKTQRRNIWSSKYWDIPRCNLWIDKERKWW